MNSRRLWIGLALANIGAVLVLALAVALRRPPVAPAAMVVVTNLAARPVAVVGVTNTVVMGFRWSQLESPDYHRYVANLKAIGCPRDTLIDIVVADVEKLYAGRIAALTRPESTNVFRYWDTRRADQSRWQNTAWRRQFGALNKEKTELLNELLGKGWQREQQKRWGGDDWNDRRLAFLTPAQRERLRELDEDFNTRMQEVWERNVGGEIGAEDKARLKDLEREKRERTAQLLSPAELEQYDLSVSSTAEALRNELLGFNPTEAEFKTLFKLRQAFDESHSPDSVDWGDEESAAPFRKAQEEMQASLKAAIAPERRAEYERAQNPQYREAFEFANGQGLGDDVAQHLFDLRQTVDANTRQLAENPDLTDEQRKAALAAIRDATEKEFSGVLGDQAFTAYRRAQGAWIKQIGK